MQTVLSIFMTKHLQVLVSSDRKVVFGKWTGPGEVLIGVMLLILVSPFIPSIFATFLNSVYFWLILVIIYMGVISMLIVDIVNAQRYHNMIMVLVIMVIMTLSGRKTVFDIVSEGLFMALLMGEIIL